MSVSEFLLDRFVVVSHLQRDVQDAVGPSHLVSLVLDVLEELVEAISFAREGFLADFSDS